MTTPSSQSLGAITAGVQHFVPFRFGGLWRGTQITELNFKTLGAVEQEQNLILFRKEAFRYIGYLCADIYQRCDFNRLVTLSI